MPLTPELYGALAVAKALEVYERTGLRVNRAYTVPNMLATTTKITGRHFRRTELTQAADALRDYVGRKLMESAQ